MSEPKEDSLGMEQLKQVTRLAEQTVKDSPAESAMEAFQCQYMLADLSIKATISVQLETLCEKLDKIARAIQPETVGGPR